MENSAYPSASPIMYTYGGLHVGDATFASAFAAGVQAAFRVVNLADFVPQLTGLSTDDTSYVHVGQQVWSIDDQTWRRRLEDITYRNLNAAEWRQFHGAAPYRLTIDDRPLGDGVTAEMTRQTSAAGVWFMAALLVVSLAMGAVLPWRRLGSPPVARGPAAVALIFAAAAGAAAWIAPRVPFALFVPAWSERLLRVVVVAVAVVLGGLAQKFLDLRVWPPRRAGAAGADHGDGRLRTQVV